MSKKPTDLYDINVTGPDVTGTLSAADRAYIKAMHDLDRVVIVGYDNDEGTYYLASVEHEVPRVP